MELFGRDRELAILIDRLGDHRLVTVVGPGGIGKTALARAAAGRLGDAYPLGAHLVDLTLVDSPDAVGGALAAQLGFPSFAALLASPSDQPALVVVDNCEHVIDAAAETIDDLLEACHAPTVLATSRSPLDLPGESLVVLGPLPVPSRELPDADVPSMRLFAERARDAGAVVSDQHLDAVGALCRALDGVPLAIEIAAARARVLTPAEIVARLGDPTTLSRSRFRGAQRHRSLRAATEWSYQLLPEADREVFDRLGVFAGPFTAEMAHAVSAEPGVASATTLDHLAVLVSASLLTVDQTGSVTRYRQLGTLRAYALEQLQSRGVLDRTRERFVDHVQRVALDAIASGRERWDGAVLDALLSAFDNLAAALRWCLAHDDRPQRALILLAVMWGVVQQAHADDVGALGEEVLQRWPDPSGAIWADAAATVATCRFLLGRPTAALELAERALPVAERSPLAPCTLRRVVGQSRWAIGDAPGALESFRAGVAEARARGVRPMALELTVFQAQAAADLGAPDDALVTLREVQVEATAAGSNINTVWARAAEGYILLRVDAARALGVIEDALAMSRRIGYPAGVAVNLQSLAMERIITGRLGDAAAILVELFEDVVARGVLSELRTVLHTTAVVLHRVAHPAWPDLAVTAAALPVVSMFAAPGRELFTLPDGPGRVLSTRDAVVLARRALATIVDRDAPVGLADAAPDHGLFVRTGDYWEVGFAGRTVHLRPSKGMSDLARLLTAPGREIHSLELAGAGAEQSPTGELVDDIARRRYEQRIRELQGEIDEADAHNDHVRSVRAHAEFDSLVEHLSAALGLGGRGRRQGATAERARSAVTQRVRGTIKRIAADHPELGRHLNASVVTGTFCSYSPERPVDWKT